MQKLYAKLCQEVKERGYEGIDTEFADITVDNNEGTISVDFELIKFINSVHIEDDKIVPNET